VRTRDMRIDSVPTSYNRDDPTFKLHVSRRGGHRVVRVGGELDVATRAHVRHACLAGRGNTVVVEMAGISFMDCSGYGGLVAARLILEASGGSLTLRHQTGQPAELLDMLARLQSAN
jgi:anti-anti-sigma factor